MARDWCENDKVRNYFSLLMIFSLDVGGKLTEMSVSQIIWRTYPSTQAPTKTMDTAGAFLGLQTQISVARHYFKSTSKSNLTKTYRITQLK